MFGIDERGRLGWYYIAGAIRIEEKKKKGRTKIIIRAWVRERPVKTLCVPDCYDKKSRFDGHGDSRGGIVANSQDEQSKLCNATVFLDRPRSSSPL